MALVAVLRLLVVADHLVDDEAQELLPEIGIELGIFGKAAQAGDLALLAARVAGGGLYTRRPPACI